MLPGHPVMPRYFFNVYRDQVLIDDGEELLTNILPGKRQR
jgi:hypothetical protein